MRLSRFTTYLMGQIAEAADPAIDVAVTFADDTDQFHDKPAGVRFRFTTGAQIYVQTVRASPPGGDVGGERIVEGAAALPPVALPNLDVTSGKVDVARFENWLAAVVTNGGSREIARVRRYSRGEGKSAARRPGVGVDFHSGTEICLLFVYALSAGQPLRADREYITTERI